MTNENNGHELSNSTFHLIIDISYLRGRERLRAVKDMIITDLAAVISRETKGHPLVIGRNALFYSEAKN
jgi:hypothetical protein